MKKMKLKQLEGLLGSLEQFSDPKIELEQYPTGAHIASRMLFSAENSFGDISNKVVADFGCGCGTLGLAAALLGAEHVVGVDIDPDSLELASSNAEDLELDMEFVQCDVRNFGWRGQIIDTVVMNPPFGTRKKGADMDFLSVALKVASQAVYSLHKTTTRDASSPLHNAPTAIETGQSFEHFLYGAWVAGICNGLHCLFNMETDIFLWNPATRECRNIPTAPTEFLHPFELDRSSLCGFGYDAVNDDYKVLRIRQPNSNDLSGSKVTIYSLKTNSWKSVQNIPREFQFWGNWGILFNGALHWIAIKSLGFETSITILAFDLGFENYREVPKPKVQKNFVGDMSILKFAESLCFLEFHPDRIDVWAMNDPGMGNTWGKLFAVEQPKVTRSCMSVRPIVYSKCRKNVLLEVDSEMVMWYNLESKKVKTVKIANLPDTFDFDVYTESLVSPEYNSSCDTKQLQKQPLEKKKQQQQQKRNKSRDKFLSKGFKLVL